MELWILGGSFLLLLLVGVPVAFAIGLSSVAAMLAADLPVALVFQKMVGGMQVFSLPGHPLLRLCRRADAATAASPSASWCWPTDWWATCAAGWA
jgi:hypothetical protein